jgi:hypothetical protein
MIVNAWKSAHWKLCFYCITMEAEVICFSETLVNATLTGGCNQMIRMNMNCHEIPQFHSVWTSVCKLHWANCGMLLGSTHSSDYRRNFNVVFWLSLSLFGIACYKLIIHIYSYTSLNKVFKIFHNFKGNSDIPQIPKQWLNSRNLW